MEVPPVSRDGRRTARTFAIGAGFGFLIGAFVVAAIVWQYGNVVGSRAASREFPAHAPAALDRWSDGIDDAGEGVIRNGNATDAGEAATGTTGAVAVPAPSPEPVLSAPPAEALADRDLLIPVEGVSEDQLTRSFSDSRGSRPHEAIDILAPRNTPVRAVEDGTIARLFFSKAGASPFISSIPRRPMPTTTPTSSVMPAGWQKDTGSTGARSSDMWACRATPRRTRRTCISPFSA